MAGPSLQRVELRRRLCTPPAPGTSPVERRPLGTLGAPQPSLAQRRRAPPRKTLASLAQGPQSRRRARTLPLHDKCPSPLPLSSSGAVGGRGRGLRPTAARALRPGPASGVRCIASVEPWDGLVACTCRRCLSRVLAVGACRGCACGAQRPGGGRGGRRVLVPSSVIPWPRVFHTPWDYVRRRRRCDMLESPSYADDIATTSCRRHLRRDPIGIRGADVVPRTPGHSYHHHHYHNHHHNHHQTPPRSSPAAMAHPPTSSSTGPPSPAAPRWCASRSRRPARPTRRRPGPRPRPRARPSSRRPSSATAPWPCTRRPTSCSTWRRASASRPRPPPPPRRRTQLRTRSASCTSNRSSSPFSTASSTRSTTPTTPSPPPPPTRTRCPRPAAAPPPSAATACRASSPTPSACSTPPPRAPGCSAGASPPPTSCSSR